MVVIGQSWSTEGPEAFHWTHADGITGLGYLPGGKIGSSAYAVSADGLVGVSEGSNEF